MITALRIFFSIVLMSMLWVTTWASMQCALWETPRAVATHPWFIATLFDTYWAFFTFYAWLAYKERAWAAKILWFIAIVLLGNIAMAVYVLIQLFRVKADAKMEDVLLQRE